MKKIEIAQNPILLLEHLKDKSVGSLKGSEIQKIEIKQKIRGHNFQGEIAGLLEYKICTEKQEKIVYGFFSSEDNSLRLINKKTFLFELSKHVFPHKKLKIAKPLGFYPEINLLLRERAEGKTLLKMIKQKQNLKQVIKGSALWIARMHNTAIEQTKFTPLWKMQKNEFAFFIKTAQEHLPQQADKINNILLSIEQINQKTRKQGLTHGDFQAQNIIYNEKDKSVSVIDFDHSGIGDPLYDIGSFLIQFDYHSFEHLSENKIIKLKKLFLKHYFKKNKQNQVSERINAYQAKFAIQRLIWTLGYIFDPKNSQFNNEEQQTTINNLIKKAEKALKDKQGINLTVYPFRALPE